MRGWGASQYVHMNGPSVTNVAICFEESLMQFWGGAWWYQFLHTLQFTIFSTRNTPKTNTVNTCNIVALVQSTLFEMCGNISNFLCSKHLSKCLRMYCCNHETVQGSTPQASATVFAMLKPPQSDPPFWHGWSTTVTSSEPSSSQSPKAGVLAFVYDNFSGSRAWHYRLCTDIVALNGRTSLMRNCKSTAVGHGYNRIKATDTCSKLINEMLCCINMVVC